MAASEESMRDQLEAAFNESEEETETEEVGGSEEDTEESTGTTTEESEGEESTEADSGDDSEGEADGEADESSDEATAEDQLGAAEEQDTGESDLKPPASWKPAARETWKNLPKDTQLEVIRREKHMDTMMRESAEARKHHTQFQEVIRPFEGLMASRGATPFESITNLMSTAAGLTLGTPQQKATIVRNIINEYGVDIGTLDAVLSEGMGSDSQGGAAPAVDSGLQQMLERELGPIKNFMGQLQTQQRTYVQNQEQAYQNEIDQFAADPKNEFFGDVRNTMADLMEMAASRGESMSIQQAYDKACRMDDSISTILQKRQAAARAGVRQKEALRKRQASASMSGEPTGDEVIKSDNSIRGALMNAFDDAV